MRRRAKFHPGTEDEMLRVVAAEAPRGDVSATLAVIDRFCRSSHWMMHVGDVKGAILRAPHRAAPGLWVELGAYCGYSAVLLASQMHDTEPNLAGHGSALRRVEPTTRRARGALRERVKVPMQSSPDETAAIYALVREVSEPDDPAPLRRPREGPLSRRPRGARAAPGRGLRRRRGQRALLRRRREPEPYLEHVRTSYAASSTLHEAPVEVAGRRA